MERYFKIRINDPKGVGVGWGYAEFSNDWTTRQIEIYEDGREYFIDSPDEYFPDTGGFLSDQPLSRSLNVFTSEAEIPKEEFEKIWKTQENNSRVMPKAKIKKDISVKKDNAGN